MYLLTPPDTFDLHHVPTWSFCTNLLHPMSSFRKAALMRYRSYYSAMASPLYRHQQIVDECFSPEPSLAQACVPPSGGDTRAFISMSLRGQSYLRYTGVTQWGAAPLFLMTLTGVALQTLGVAT